MTDKVNQLLCSLEQLQRAECRSSRAYREPGEARALHAAADDALRLLFHIGREHTSLTQEQKRAVATQLVAAIKHLQINIEGHGFEYRRRLNSLILKKRSALQFLVDTYGSVPVPGPGRTLADVFEQVRLKETIGILDEIIEEYRKESDSDDDGSDSDDARSDREFSGVPSSHSWWF